jgi:hypothetical protein
MPTRAITIRMQVQQVNSISTCVWSLYEAGDRRPERSRAVHSSHTSNRKTRKLSHLRHGTHSKYVRRLTMHPYEEDSIFPPDLWFPRTSTATRHRRRFPIRIGWGSTLRFPTDDLLGFRIGRVRAWELPILIDRRADHRPGLLEEPDE